MASFTSIALLRAPLVAVVRFRCDGCDGARPADEHTCGARLWLPTSGRFVLRDRDGRHAIDPAAAVALPADHAYTVRHPDGPDTCLSFQGPVVDELVARRPRAFLPDAAAHARLLAAARGLGPNSDGLDVIDALGTLEPPDRGPVRRAERDLAEALEFEVHRDPTADLPLETLAARVGVSMYHACRTFRRATGSTLGGYRREVRLRLALALLLDGGLPVGEIALRAGFASQSHLTNRFRERFGAPPGALRAAGRVA